MTSKFSRWASSYPSPPSRMVTIFAIYQPSYMIRRDVAISHHSYKRLMRCERDEGWWRLGCSEYFRTYLRPIRYEQRGICRSELMRAVVFDIGVTDEIEHHPICGILILIYYTINTFRGCRLKAIENFNYVSINSSIQFKITIKSSMKNQNPKFQF